MKISKFEDLPVPLLERIADANVFFQKGFVDYVRINNDELYYLYDDERIVPIRHRKKMIFNFCEFETEPLCLSDNTHRSEQEFLDEAMGLLKLHLHVQWCHSTPSCFFSDTPSHNCKRIPFGSHVIDLSNEESVLWSNVHSKHRNVIRKATKEEVIIREGDFDLVDDYARLEQETYERTGRSPSGVEYYKKQLIALGNNIRVYIAYHDGKPQAGGVFFFNSQRCYYMYGATTEQCVTGSANLLLWTAILNMKEIGVKEFSFVGCRINEDPDSKYHGIQKFKERFGGTLRTGYMFRFEIRPLFYRLFCNAMQIRLRSRVPYRDPIDEEIGKWINIQVK